MKQYKFLDLKDGKIVSRRGNHVWEVGKTYQITGELEICGNGFHASKQPLDALSYVNGDALAIVQGNGQAVHQDDKSAFSEMTITAAYRWTKADSVALAIYAAELVIPIYEDKYPDDSQPRQAVEAAKAWLKEPSEDNRQAADAAAYAAADAARAAAYAAARAAYAARAADAAARAAYAARAARAADAAAYAAYAAADAARAARAARAADAARAAAYAAARAAYAARAELQGKINRWMKARIKKLERIG